MSRSQHPSLISCQVYDQYTIQRMVNQLLKVKAS